MIAELRVVMVVLGFTTCGADSSRRAPIEVKLPIDANVVVDPVAVPIDAGAPVADAASDVGVVAVDAGAANHACFCFSWVHRDENGSSCYETKATCDIEFKRYGRTDKIPCAIEHRVSCGSYACRNGGKQCFQLR